MGENVFGQGKFVTVGNRMVVFSIEVGTILKLIVFFSMIRFLMIHILVVDPFMSTVAFLVFDYLYLVEEVPLL